MSKRVLIGSIKQESNGFNHNKTPLAAFIKQGLFEGQHLLDHFRDLNIELGGFMEVGRDEGWEIIPSVASFAPPSGPVEDEAFELLCGKLTDALKAAMPVDGVLLSLHGSMMVDSFEDSELEIVRRVRAIIGPDVVLMTSLDPHCNISPAMAGVIDGMYAFRTSPHVDQRLTGIRTAKMMAEAFARGRKPTCILERRAMLTGFDGARTYHDHGPFREAIALAATFEAEPDILSISIHAGYSKADSELTGPSVAVTGYAPEARLREIGNAMMDECWRTKERTSERIVSIDEAMQAVLARKPGEGPVVLGDYGDSLGGGGYGDGTAILKAFIDADVQNAVLTPIYEPDSVRKFIAAGVGAKVRLALGGKNNPRMGGGPLDLEWEVRRISDGNFRYTGPYGTGTTGTFGDSVVVRHGGVDVIVTSIHKGIYDQDQLRIYGIEPVEKDVIMVKSMQGYRADFQAMASRCLDVDSRGITSHDPTLYDWNRVPRPIWPLDDVPDMGRLKKK